MSAFVMNPEEIGLIAAYATVNKVKRPNDPEPEVLAAALAEGLAKENIKSVAYRYPDDADGERPGPCLFDAQIIKASQLYAVHFIKDPVGLQGLANDFQVLAVIKSYNHQSCEHEEWEGSKAALLTARLEAFIAQKTGILDPNVLSEIARDEPTWRLDSEQRLPAVQKMYDDYRAAQEALTAEPSTETQQAAQSIIEQARQSSFRPRG